ncbi:sigma factor-like helix-turn-helix DNA-binding protein [Mammaliicoccus sciuri]|uniref:sigma factor-like helix-turn-helix DNA-binding protein n=1 Tax=Mammaliicoccus sciuri TaxID=1296 RepID=UPI002B258EA5|nr:sigma factor-like helix-turn-helix DNA-binding protein [Mammaliicoccus sciuri]WQK74136.1 sigma factor-like helix-turn-helix DNA-binding protein [Mammaliicoccus sciuri]
MHCIDDKQAMKEFISNYHKLAKPINYQEEDLDTFFNLNDDTEIMHDHDIDAHIRFNEIESIIEKVASDKEYFIFLLLSEGKTYREVGKYFNLSGERVRQIYNGMIERLP